MLLPLTAAPDLVPLRDFFTEKLLEGLKKSGFNAVGTRYLTAALQIDTCTSISCKERIANLVGARFVVYGALSGDSITFRLNTKVIDISTHTELYSAERVLVGGSQALDLFMPELIIFISEATKQSSARIEPIKNIQQPISLAAESSEPQPTPENNQVLSSPEFSSNTPSNSGNSLLTVQTLDNIQAQEKVEKDTLKSNLAPDSSTEIHSHALTAEASAQLSESDTSADETAATLHNNADQEQVLNTTAPSVTVQDQLNPSGVSTEISTDNKAGTPFFKRGRIIISANLAVASLISGLILNNQVKRSLSKENTAYSNYMSASRDETASTYKTYLDQTTHTNRLSVGRGIMYGITAISLAGVALSIYF